MSEIDKYEVIPAQTLPRSTRYTIEGYTFWVLIIMSLASYNNMNISYFRLLPCYQESLQQVTPHIWFGRFEPQIQPQRGFVSLSGTELAKYCLLSECVNHYTMKQPHNKKNMTSRYWKLQVRTFLGDFLIWFCFTFYWHIIHVQYWLIMSKIRWKSLADTANACMFQSQLFPEPSSLKFPQYHLDK